MADKREGLRGAAPIEGKTLELAKAECGAPIRGKVLVWLL